MKAGVMHIGLPELGEEELIKLGELAQEAIITHIFDALNKSDVKDIEVTTRINRDETLDLEVEVYLEVPVFVRVNVEKLIDEALEKAYATVERRLREIADEGKDKTQTLS